MVAGGEPSSPVFRSIMKSKLLFIFTKELLCDEKCFCIAFRCLDDKERLNILRKLEASSEETGIKFIGWAKKNVLIHDNATEDSSVTKIIFLDVDAPDKDMCDIEQWFLSLIQ